VLACHGVNRAALPAFERILLTVGQAQHVFVLVDIEAILQQLDAGMVQHLLELGHLPHEVFVLNPGAKAHGTFDALAVVRAAVEQDQFLRHRKGWHAALWVPATQVAVRRFSWRDHTGLARAEVLDDALDAVVLARRVGPFQQYQNVVAALNLETAVDRFLPLDTPYELQLLCAPARSPQW